LVTATTIPITTNTMIAICIQIQVGDIAQISLLRGSPGAGANHAVRDYRKAMGKRLRMRVVPALFGSWMLALLVPAGNAVGAQSHLARSTAPLGGVNIAGLDYGSDAAQADRTIAWARQLHAEVVRAGVPWSVLEPSAPGRRDARALAFTDRLVSDAAANHIRVIMTVDSPPCWASSAPAPLLRLCRPSQLSAANAWPPGHPADYASFVGYLARRYGTHLAAIEIWNEPDQVNQRYFAGPNKPARYAAVLRAAYTAIKQANPGVAVLAGSLVGSNGAFLRALYSAGIRGHYDGLAVHFYNLTLASLRALHEVQVANGDTKPLWLDEFGWSSCYPKRRVQEEQACVTPRIQARNLADIFRSLARTSYVGAVVAYDLQNSGTEQFGVLTSAGTVKPAFAALSGALTRPFAAPSQVTLNLRAVGGRVLASGSAPVGDYMQLEAFNAGGVLRYSALFVLDRFNRYAIALPAVLGTHGLIVRVYQYWAGLGADAQRSL
jgi:hypothetical protein